MIVAGFGFRHAASLDSLKDVFDQCSKHWKIDAVATLRDKVDGLRDLAVREGLPILAVDDLSQIETQTQSAPSLTARGTTSVSEAAALAAAGPGAKLILPRVVSKDRMATCALAKGEPE